MECISLALLSKYYFLETKIYDKSRAAEKEEGGSYKQRVECVGEPHGWYAVLVVGFAVILLEVLHRVAAGSEGEKKSTIFLYYEFPIVSEGVYFGQKISSQF